jgi:hypothetical protein
MHFQPVEGDSELKNAYKSTGNTSIYMHFLSPKEILSQKMHIRTAITQLLICITMCCKVRARANPLRHSELLPAPPPQPGTPSSRTREQPEPQGPRPRITHAPESPAPSLTLDLSGFFRARIDILLLRLFLYFDIGIIQCGIICIALIYCV